MDNIKAAIHNLQGSLSAEKRKGKIVEDALMQLHSTANLLKLSTVPPNTFKRLSELLRQRLLPLYQASLTRTLQYSSAVLEFIQEDKLIPALNAKDESLKQLWEQLLTSLVSGVLDYLDQNPDARSRESIASVLYPILCRIYFSPSPMFLSEFSGGMLSAAYQLLVTTVEPQARNAARLRDHGISSKRLGLTLSQIRDFLAIESLLDIICTLIPPIKNGLEKRSQFIKEVFDPDLFQCSKSILQILESITDGDWSITAVKIIEALANSDVSFPQPFDASSLMICGISVNAIAPFYVDKSGFLANLDQDGKLETLHVPFHTVTKVVKSSINNAEISIVLILNMPPIVGTEPLSVTSGRGFSVSWHLKKSQLDKFVNAAKDRNLIFLNSTTRKLSLPGSHITFNLPADKQPQQLVSTQEKIHDMAKLLAMNSSPRLPYRTESSSSNQQSQCSSPREQKAADIIQPAKLGTTTVGDDEHRAFSVFLDRSGNLSFTDPSQLVNEASIEQSLGDSTLLATSTSGIPRHLVQWAAKNQDDVAAVISTITRSNNVAPQIVQKPPTGKPNTKSAPAKISPAIKHRANLQAPQITTLGAQAHDTIISQACSAAPIDVDKFPDSKETIPLLKTQKHPPAAPETMIRKITTPLDEPRQLEIDRIPVDFKSESKKRSCRNMEDNEAIHGSDQEHPTKRVRIEPSRPALPFQRQKYGKNGRTSSPRAESPAVLTVDFDEIPEPKHTRAVERPKPRVSTVKSRRVGKNTESKPAAPQKKKQEPQDVKVDIKPIALTVPVSSAKAKRDNQAKESLSEMDHHPVEQRTTTGLEMKPDPHPTNTHAIKTQGNNVNSSQKKTQTAPWEDRSFLQKVEGTLDPIHVPSTKETWIQEDETSDYDHSLTLLVDDDNYTQEKEVVEHQLPTLLPDIVMLDLTQDSPIPARISTRGFPKSSLKEDKRVADVQPALPGKQTKRVKVEILSPHVPPAKDRCDERPSVSFALPIQPQRYSWPETSIPARKKRADLDSRSHKIRKSWEELDHNNVSQQRCVKKEEKKYEQPEEPIERIAEIIKQISEAVVQQISRRFDSVRDELHAGHQRILQGTLEHLERMHEESAAHVANMVGLEEAYAFVCGNILKGSDDYRESAKNVSSCLKNIVKDQNRSKEFPAKLFDKRTGIVLNATIGSL